MNPNRHYIFDCVDAYTAGNPVRLVKSPKPDLKGITMGEKRIHFIKEFDWIRTGLMFEPHGHDMMSGSFFYPPQNSKNDESFEHDLLEYPQYTKPQIWEKKSVPEVLLSGNHSKIKDWRLSQSKDITRRQRPDMWKKFLEKEKK